MGGVLFKTDSRRIIPRWREYKLVSATNETAPISSANDSDKKFNIHNLSEQVNSWKKYKTIAHASDLFSSAYSLGLETEVKEVAQFLNEHKEIISKKLAFIVEGILNPIENNEELFKHQIDILDPAGEILIRKNINRIRTYLNKEPNNAIGWMELGRFHSLQGNVTKAKNSVATALQVDPQNRYVLRSAARFYHHIHEDERAITIIKKSDNLTKDPWLLASELAFSSILGRNSRHIKPATKLLDQYQNYPFHTAELASALATIELRNGSYKAARKLFKTSLIQPNENTVAQALWSNQDMNGIDIRPDHIILPLAFEAKAHKFYFEGKFKESFHESLRWLNDEPFSSRPIRLASYIAYTFLEMNNLAVSILKRGVEKNPDDAGLINNLTYTLLLEGKTEEAVRVFERLFKKSIPDLEPDLHISFLATSGLIQFRNGDPLKGRELYLQSINLAKSRSNTYLLALAYVNYAREEIAFDPDSDYTEKVVADMENACKNRREFDVLKLYRSVFGEYQKKKILIK